MKTKLHSLFIALTLAALSTIDSQLSTALAQGTAFTYQGELFDNGAAANGSYALRFTLYDASNTLTVVGGPLVIAPVTVSNGLFTVLLDYGPSEFAGAPRWLQIDSATNSVSPLYVPMTPRQLLSPAPYAIFANTASNLSGTLPTAQLNGTVLNNQIANNSITVTAGAGLGGGGVVPLGGSTSLTIPGGAVINSMLANPSLTVSAGTGLKGGGVVALGSSTTLTNTGVISVTGNVDITASPTNGNVILGDTATSANTANTIVKRDGTGSFSAGIITGNGSGLTSVNASTLGGLTAASFWQTGGNGGTTPGVNFLGTTDNNPLELWVNGGRALRLEPDSSSLSAPNVIGGSSANSVDTGVSGAVIGGGGSSVVVIVGGIPHIVNFPNKVSASFSGISSGEDNWIQAGSSNSFIGGGINNTIGTNCNFATIGGGSQNTNGTLGSTIAGGENNTVAPGSYDSAIGGGLGNTIQGSTSGATIPGGSGNVAAGVNSFAAGRQAHAMHDGSFVWSDNSLVAPFSDTGSEQFCIRAVGGVQLDPSTTLSFNATNEQMITFASANESIGENNDSLVFRGRYFNWCANGLNLEPRALGGNVVMQLDDLGDLFIGGTLSQNSDRNVKTNFAVVDSLAILDRVTALPMLKWTYKTEPASTRHLGPTAQDFYSAFHLGMDDTHITTIDEGGVALAAIQGLNQKVDAENAALRAENAELKQQLAATQKEFAARLALLEKAVAGITEKSAPTLAATFTEK